MKSNDGSQNETVHDALRSLRKVSVEPSPFLAARVQANLQATRSRAFPWMKFVSGFAVAACLALAFWMVPRAGSGAMYALGQPYMIKVDVRAISAEEVAYAEVELRGEAAAFNSKAFENLAQSQKFTVAGDVLRNKQYLPIVVKGVKSGKSEVLVSFFNRQHQLISSRSIDLAFTEGT